MKTFLRCLVAFVAVTIICASLSTAEFVQHYNLAREDSLTSATVDTIGPIPILGAKLVVFMVRDSAYAAVPSDGSTCCSPYADSLGAAILDVSMDGSNWHNVANLSGIGAAVNDTLQIAYQGKLLGMPLSRSTIVAGNRSGYLTAMMWPYPISTSASSNRQHITMRYARIRCQAVSRPRDNDIAGSAAILGWRARAIVFYDDDQVPSYPRWAE